MASTGWNGVARGRADSGGTRIRAVAREGRRRRGYTPRQPRDGHGGAGDQHAFNPTAYLRAWNFSDLPSRGDPSSIARRRGPTARCCASTRSSPSIARSRSRPGCSFRPGPTTDRCRARRFAPPKATASRSRSGTSGSHPHTMHFHGWHPPAMDGALPGQEVHAGRDVRLRVRRRPVRAAPLSLPHRAAEAAHPQRPVRRVHHRSRRRPPAGRRDGDGDECVRHELRRRERGVRGQHGRQRLHARSDTRDRRPARAHLSGQRHRVRSRSTACTCTRCSSTSSAPARR